jgi:hypothetical protein
MISEENYSSDSMLLRSTKCTYLRTGQLSSIIKTYGFNNEKSDTIKLTYNNAGQLISYCVKGECIERLFNSKQQLIVKRNALYGYIRGDYTYDYDKEGRLVQRRFLEANSGIVLCTDTIRYEFAGLEKDLITEKHAIRIAGTEEWIPIDEMVYDKAKKKVISYTIYHFVIRGSRGINAPGNIGYTYNSNGELAETLKKDKSGTYKYFYKHLDGKDSVLGYAIVEGKETYSILSYQSVTTYDANGLVISVIATDYKVANRRKSRKSSVSQIREEKYQWN